jgi:hypothetical protein
LHDARDGAERDHVERRVEVDVEHLAAAQDVVGRVVIERRHGPLLLLLLGVCLAFALVGARGVLFSVAWRSPGREPSQPSQLRRQLHRRFDWPNMSQSTWFKPNGNHIG